MQALQGHWCSDAWSHHTESCFPAFVSLTLIPPWFPWAQLRAGYSLSKFAGDSKSTQNELIAACKSSLCAGGAPSSTPAIPLQCQARQPQCHSFPLAPPAQLFLQRGKHLYWSICHLPHQNRGWDAAQHPDSPAFSSSVPWGRWDSGEKVEKCKSF